MTYDKPIDTPQPVAGVSITDTIREALEGRLLDHCNHIFTWDSQWDGNEGSLHCPKCLDVAKDAAEAVAAALTNGGHVDLGVNFHPGGYIEKVSSQKAAEVTSGLTPGSFIVSRVVGPWVRAE